MADARRYVFRASRNAHTQLTRLFDFVHPAAIAMWNMKWQVEGYIAAAGNVTSEMLSHRFATGSGIGGGSLKRTYVDSPWEAQQSMFAQLLLTNSIAAFEYFTAELAALTGASADAQRRLASSLQFPGKRRKDAYRKLGPKSPALKAAFDWDHFVTRRYAPDQIDNLLKCYRYFKEIRNAIAHNGGVAARNTVEASTDFVPVADKASLGVDHVPEHVPITAVGDPVTLNLRGVIGFTDVLLRIIATYDVDLSELAIGETEIVTRFPKQIPGRWQRHSTAAKRNRQISKKMDVDATLPKVLPTPALVKFLKLKKIVPDYA